MNISVLLQIAPVVPARLVVLAVGVVISLLGTTELVATQQHRHTARNEQRQEEVLDLTVADRFNAQIGRRTFDPVVRTVLDFPPITVTLTIGQIVFTPEADQIVQGKAIMAGHEVDTALRPFAGAPIQILAAADPAG